MKSEMGGDIAGIDHVAGCGGWVVAVINSMVETLPELDLQAWLEEQAGNYLLKIPSIDVSNKIADDRREWIITNGLGSYASANIWGANTRRYHGLFVASMDPPVSRKVLLSHVDETVDRQLATNYWRSQCTAPQGYKNISAFTIYPVPTWAYSVAGGFLIKQVAMLPGKQAVYVGYSWQGDHDIELSLDLMINKRDFHGEMHGNADWSFEPEFSLSYDKGNFQKDASWYWDYY